MNKLHTAAMNSSFSCFNSNLSHDFITPVVWVAPAEGDINYQKIYSSPFLLIYMILHGHTLEFVGDCDNYMEAVVPETHLYTTPESCCDRFACMCAVYAFWHHLGNIQRGPSDVIRCQVCYAVVIITIVFLFVTFFTIAIMSFDRVLYLKIPLRYERYVTASKVSIAIIITWLACIILALPPVFGFGDVFFSKPTGSCTLLLHNETSVAKTIYYGLLLVFVASTCYIVTLAFNIWLLCIARKSLLRRNRNQEKESNSTHFNKQQVRLAQVFGAIFAANTLLWMPSFAILIVLAIRGTNGIPYSVYNFVYIVFFANSSITREFSCRGWLY